MLKFGSVKKIISIFLILIYIMCTSSQIAMADIFQGHAEKSNNVQQVLDKELFTGAVDELNSKDVIYMSVSQVLDASFTLEGDEFFAEVTSDVTVIKA